jgi:hypothetical protein
LDLVRNPLLHFLHSACQSQYSIDVPVECVHEDVRSATCTLRFGVARSWQPEARVSVRHAGGNIYEIIVDATYGEPVRLMRSIPAEATPADRLVQRLAAALGKHMLQGLERGLGRRALQGQRVEPRPRRTRQIQGASPASQSVPGA